MITIKRSFILTLSLLIPLLSACLPEEDSAYNYDYRETTIFGVRIRATAAVPDHKLIHAATIMAEYLDNDEDGRPDNPDIIETLTTNNALLLMLDENEDPDDLLFGEYDNPFVQTLFIHETIPDAASRDEFDATLEEVLHLITYAGYSQYYPAELGETADSQLGQAMNLARGGYFEKVPREYPEDAWYTYDDQTCDYQCQIAEYFYWALTSILGAQDFPGRLEEIEHEWRPNSYAKMQQMDPTTFALMTNPKFNLPTQLPDGQYTPFPLIVR